MTQEEKDHLFMKKAIKMAHRAALVDEVPVGAVVEQFGQIIGHGFNHPIQNNDPCAHAEIIALRDAAQNIGNYRIPNSTLYVTLEPCAMCLGAIIHSRIDRVVFGAHDPKTGVLGGVCNMLELSHWNHRPEVLGGVLSEECAKVIKDFFRELRA